MKKAVADTSASVHCASWSWESCAQLASNSSNKSAQTGIMGVRYSNNYMLQI